MMVPVVALPLATPSTAQVTDGSAAPFTVAASICEAPVLTVAVAGLIDTVLGTAATAAAVAVARDPWAAAVPGSEDPAQPMPRLSAPESKVARMARPG